MNKREYGNLSFEQLTTLHESTKQCLKEEINRLTKEVENLKDIKNSRLKQVQQQTAEQCAEIAGQTSKIAEHRIKLRFEL